MTNMPNHIVWVNEETLTDQSKVYNVDVFGTIFPAITKSDADEMVNKITNAINKHTNETAGIMSL